MDQNQRRARAIAMRKGQPLPRIRAALDGVEQPTTEDLAALREQLREEIRDARGTLKDLHREIRAAREAIEATRSVAAELAETHVRPLLEAEVIRQVDALREETSGQMRKSVANVIAEFDTLRDLLLGNKRPPTADRQDERSIPELLQDPAILAHAQRRAQHNAREADRD